jgi:carbamoyl-phosphate synthase large subunit
MDFNVLLSSVGRRVSLVKFFKEALNGQGYVYGADCDPTAPALYAADRSFLVPRVTEKDYIPFLLDKCKKENIKLIVPLIDPELLILARERENFLERGIIPLVSSYETVRIGYDKLLTHKFLVANFLPSPKTFAFKEELSEDELDFPLIIKPRFGSASIGVQKCEDYQDVLFYSRKISEPILQEFLQGDEITIDVLCDFEGNPLSIVQRKRIKVRAGEVERGITIKNYELLSLALELVKKLNPLGVINIQCFSTSKGFFFTEINPRFGGGYPLAHFAGANFPKLLIQLAKGEKVQPLIGDYKEGILMLRYDEAIFIKENELLK